MKSIRLGLAASLLLSSGCGSGLNIGEAPVFHNMIVDIQSCVGTCTAGAFSFSPTGPSPTVFGGSVLSPSGPKIIPNMEFKVLEDAIIMSPMHGMISSISKSDEQGDFAISIVPGALSAYRVEIDHVLDVRVEVGDVVVPGQALGIAGNWDNSPLGRVELQVNRGNEYVCPMDYLAESAKASVEAKMTTLMFDWETIKGDNGLYDQAAMVTPGCTVHAISD